MHLHSAIEALGSFTVLSLAALILTMQKDRGRMYSYHLLVSCALIGIGVIDLLHSISPLGDSFVWLRGMAGLVGGLLFALVWLPDRFVQQRLAYILLTAVSITSITSVVFPVAFPSILPTMAVEGAFTTPAEAINFLGGVLFLVAAAFFLTRYRRSGRSNRDLVFFNFCMLNGWTGLLFPFSDMWSAGWWFWHLLRLTAYGITIAYIFSIVRSEKKELTRINEDLQAEVFERKRVEEEASKLLKEVNTIFDNIPLGIAYFDAEYKALNANKFQYNLMGLSEEEYLGKPCYETVGEYAADPSRKGREKICSFCRLEESIKTKRPVSIERRFRDSTIRMTLVPQVEEDGTVSHFMKVVEDITQQKRGEEALRESEQRFQALSDAAFEGVAISENGVILEVNRSLANMFGYSPSDLVGRYAPDLATPDYRKVIEHHIAAKSEDLYEAVFRRKDDTTFNAEIIARHREYRGRNVRTVAIRDITERKHAAEELKQSEEKYRTLINNIQDGVLIIQDLKILFANETSARMAGYKTEEVIGRNVIEFVAPEYRDAVMDRYRRRQAGEKDVPTEYECCLLHKDGKTRVLVNVNVGLVQYLGREASMITMKDITEKKKFEAQLLRAQRMESVGTLAEGIAHDMNNVLSPIMLSLCMLKERFTDSESQELLNILESGAKRGADMIKQIRSFTLGVEIEHKTLQITSLISEIKQMVRETFPRNIEIQTSIADGVWATSGDTSQLHQVLMNLSVNARDAMMPNGGILNISVENIFIDADLAYINTDAKAGPYIVISVSDTGTGIPQEIMDKIFDPFFTTKQPGKGTGLGLSTSLGIVKSHGGFINVYSEVRKGSAFKVYLPAVQVSEVQKMKEQRELPSGHGELVLVVEDEAMVCKITGSVLEANGYKVLTARDGAEAIPLYEQNKEEVKAVIMDMMLPVMDGPTCINALRKINPEVKVIAVSGLAENGSLAETKPKGSSTAPAQAFLTKPYTSDVLLKTLHDVIEAKT